MCVPVSAELNVKVTLLASSVSPPIGCWRASNIRSLLMSEANPSADVVSSTAPSADQPLAAAAHLRLLPDNGHMASNSNGALALDTSGTNNASVPAASPTAAPSMSPNADLPPPHPRPSTLTTIHSPSDTPSASLASSQLNSLSSSPTHSSLSSPPSGGSSILLPKSALTASMSDSARPIEPKPFPYQPSKQQKEGEDEYVVIEATPSDPRFSHETVHVQVSKADAAYNLQPIHCGRQVVFLNAQNVEFYKRELKSPNLSVWILCGLTVGQSHALKRLFESGWRQNIQVAIMEINKFELVCSKDGLENILYEGKAVELPDCIFNRVGASVSYFGLAVIRQLENMGCLLLNTLKSIEISRDKMLTVQHLAAHGLPIPKTILAKFPMNLQTINREFDYPIIIKKVSGSQGKGIIKVDSHQQLEDLVDMLDTGKPLIFQEFISASSGKDLRVFVIGGRVVGAMMRIAQKGSTPNHTYTHTTHAAPAPRYPQRNRLAPARLYGQLPPQPLFNPPPSIYPLLPAPLAIAQSTTASFIH